MKKPLMLLTFASLVSCQTSEKAPADEAPKEVKATELTPAEPVPAVKIDAAKPDTLIGQPLDKAQSACEAAGVPHRVVDVDGEPLPVTLDFLPERLNFKVKAGLVTAVTNG